MSAGGFSNEDRAAATRAYADEVDAVLRGWTGLVSGTVPGEIPIDTIHHLKRLRNLAFHEGLGVVREAKVRLLRTFLGSSDLLVAENLAERVRLALVDSGIAMLDQDPDYLSTCVVRVGRTQTRLRAMTLALSPTIEEHPPEPLLAQRFSNAELLKKTELSATTLRKYREKAGVTSAGSGKRNHKYTLLEVLALLDLIIRESAEKSVVSKCRAYMDELEAEAEKPREAADSSRKPQTGDPT